MRVQGIIFDMDGLMFDTERIGYFLWKKAGEEFGINLTEDIFLETIGVNIQKTKEILEKYFGKEHPFEEIYKRKIKLTEEYIEKNGVPLKEGLLDLLQFLEEKNIKKAVATSTEREYAEYLLEKAKIKEKFDVIVCGDDISKSKPEPDIFLCTAQKLNVNPKECIVLEDSDAGILAAKRAHMIPILIPDFKKPSSKTIEIAYKVFNSLKEVKDFLEKILE
ncbi:MAG TPA: HAD family phosphatase [Dictyoglomaceae bacterium]|nr:HAD family phosphatase [Dictyoglomaceae bacterium]